MKATFIAPLSALWLLGMLMIAMGRPVSSSVPCPTTTPAAPFLTATALNMDGPIPFIVAYAPSSN